MSEHRKIIHIDMDAFFASVEQRDFPQYRGRAMSVGDCSAEFNPNMGAYVLSGSSSTSRSNLLLHKFGEEVGTVIFSSVAFGLLCDAALDVPT